MRRLRCDLAHPCYHGIEFFVAFFLTFFLCYPFDRIAFDVDRFLTSTFPSPSPPISIWIGSWSEVPVHILSLRTVRWPPLTFVITISGELEARSPLALYVGVCAATTLLYASKIRLRISRPFLVPAVSHCVSRAFRSPTSRSRPVPVEITADTKLFIAIAEVFGDTYARVIRVMSFTSMEMAWISPLVSFSRSLQTCVAAYIPLSGSRSRCKACTSLGVTYIKLYKHS